MKKGNQAKDYRKMLLQDQRIWSGPWTSAEKLHVAIREHSEKAVFNAKIEMIYYAHVHKTEKV